MHFNSSQNSSTFVKSDTVFVCAYAPELTWNLNDRTFPWILLSITFVASPATVALNIVVVTAIMKMKELQTNSNLLLCSLAIADLLICRYLLLNGQASFVSADLLIGHS